MPIILHIDTATENAGVCLSRDGKILHLLENREQKNHAAFVQPAIEALVEETGIKLAEISAVAATSGPGSYTGLRVGLASAKGICYALHKPLILVNTLEVMAQALLTRCNSTEQPIDPAALVCPLIDARRMEVFTAIYDTSLHTILPPQAMILDSSAFQEFTRTKQVHFCGSGQFKLKDLLSHENVIFHHTEHSVSDLAVLADKAFESQHFADLAYSEPFYVKEFFDTARAAG